MDKAIVKVRYLREGTKRLEKFEKGDWIDLYADEDVELNYMESAMVRLGFAMQLPEGYEAYIAPRSSTFKNWGVIQTNSIGIIDNIFCGDNDEWRIEFFCLKERFDENGNKINIKRGDKIAQFRININQPDIDLDVVETLGNKDRGGFGSSGKR